MHNPKPYGLAVYGGELSEEDLSFIDHQCKKVSNFKTLSGLDTLKHTSELPSGGVLIVQDAGGIFRAIAFKPKPELIKPEQQDYLKAKIPMLFSGCIDDGIVKFGAGVEIKMTDMCQRRLAQYQGQLGGNVRLQRFRCDYDPIYELMLIPQALRGLPKDRHMFTQYDKLKAGWYSGAMREVVQIIGGYGRQDLENLPEDPIERAEMILPASMVDQIEQELKDIKLPAYYGMPDQEGTIRYQFMFNRTHLVSFDSARKPWLLQIDSSGVWAMPLPIIPATRSLAFHEYIAEIGDHEIQAILDRFGAMPSGEGFPSGDKFQQWVRAGVIIRVCDSSDFFQHSAYSSMTGWSCNTDGTHIINTCYDYVNGFCYGYTYQIQLKLGEAENQGWSTRKDTSTLDPNDSRLVGQYLEKLKISLAASSSGARAIYYKLRRVDLQEILSRAQGVYSEREVEYWDNYVCTPIAQHSGIVRCSNQGYLYGGITLKIPEPIFEGCISMNFFPVIEGNQPYSIPKIDTIVYAYFEGDDLKVIKNFYDERKLINKVEGNFEDEMIVGNWEQTEYRGLTGLEGQFYSTDFDHRQEVSPFEVYTKIEGRDCGYGTPYINYGAPYFADGVMGRARYYSHKRTVVTKYDRQISEAFVIPYHDRNAVLYAQREQHGREVTVESLQLHMAPDPNGYDIWTYDEGLHYINADMGVRRGKPYPVDSFPVWAEVHRYNNDGSAAADFSDSGPWAGGLPADITHWAQPPGGKTSVTYGGVPPNVLQYSESSEIPSELESELHLGMFTPTRLIHRKPHIDEYYTISPDQYMNALYVDACRVFFGDMQYGNISVSTDLGRRFQVGHTKLANSQYAHTFIGVINE